MARRQSRLRRLNARAAHHIYQGVRNGGSVPWLGFINIVIGIGVGAIVDEILHAQGWTPIASNRGIFWGGVVSTGWVIFAIAAGGSYGPDDRS